MLPSFREDGTLPPGIHWAVWDEVVVRFGYNTHRQRQLQGLEEALQNLKAAGCRTIYLNGSFVTSKPEPDDYDACWEPEGVDLENLDPVLLTFDSGRVTQKRKYMGELFPSSVRADPDGRTYLDWFQVDKSTEMPKGIVGVDLRRFP